ncbi:hypothetical protein [Chitinophaga pinensis]|uniref:hypothetical protein n=1 Tax=Chitinophaga pinensis TaxID=79329 RepID=UPI0001A2F259|nr:hypothetical protein [Chitinophaga pinensis]
MKNSGPKGLLGRGKMVEITVDGLTDYDNADLYLLIEKPVLGDLHQQYYIDLTGSCR